MMKKRILSMLMAMIMVFSLMPTSVLATDATAAEVVCTGVAEVLCEAATHVEGCDSYVAPAPEVTSEPTPEVTSEPTPEVTPEPTPEVTPEPTPEVTPEPTPEVTPEVKVCAEGCILAEDHEEDCYVCEAGCILEGVAEHEENGWECFVWEACTLTEGCELAAGHPDACSGSALFAGEEYDVPVHFFLGSPENITNPRGQYTNYYVGKNSATNAEQVEKYYDTLYTSQGFRNNPDEDFILSFVSEWPDNKTKAQFETFNTVTISGQRYSGSEYEIQWVTACYRNPDGPTATNCYCGVNYKHLHIDGLLIKKVEPGEMKVYKTIPEPAAADTTFNFKLEKLYQDTITSAPQDRPDPAITEINVTVTIPKGQQEGMITGAEDVTFGYYKLTEDVSTGWEYGGILFDPTSGSNYSSASRMLYVYIAPNGTVQYCDTINGTYRTMDKVTVQNRRAPVSVTYEWKLVDGSGNYGTLPASVAPSLPAKETGIAFGSEYVYNTAFTEGTSFINPQTGEMYTFHGWDTYSHNSTFNVTPVTGYTALDDGDQNAANNKKIPMTANTYIYGYWTVSQLPPASAHIAVEKKFILDDGNNNDTDITATLADTPLRDAANLWFEIDPGIDKDGDGQSLVEIDYAAILAQNGEYKLPVYQYDKNFKFIEHDADIPGYTRTTKIQVSGDNARLVKSNGDSAEVALTEVYTGTNIHLGTITYINEYQKNVGTAVKEYPKLVLGKLGTDNGNQEGAVFKLYSGETVVGTYTIPASGLVEIDFSGKAAGTYTLKEAVAPVGYALNEEVYTVKLIASDPVEELRDNKFVQVTYYTLEVTKPESSAAAISSGRTGNVHNLTVYNQPILGEVKITKSATIGDVEANFTTDLPQLNANVIIHGPITRDADNEIIDLGTTYDLYLNASNDWTITQINLPLGEYMIREAFASVHGYTWDETKVNYGEGVTTEVHNGESHALFRVEEDRATDTAIPVEINLTNAYVEWTSADFFVYKVDENDENSFLSGAEFTLYSDEACTTVVTTKTTGPAGWAQFSGFTVPAEDADGIVAYYLKETKAPAGYYLDDTVYQVEIKATTKDNKTTYEPRIRVKNSEGAWVDTDVFDKAVDQLTVTNAPVVGKFTVEKEFVGDKTVAAVSVEIRGPHNFEKTVQLNEVKDWKEELTNLAMGTYTITEEIEPIPGYTLNTTYSTRTVTLTDTTAGVVAETAAGAVMDGGTVTITNEYVRNVGETYEIPTELTVLKVDQNGDPLAGAVFNLTDGAGYNRTRTTGADGTVVFHDLAGKIVDGQAQSVTYTLTETSAPDGYVKTQETWQIVVKEDNGEIRVVLNNEKNLFESFWDWITHQEQSYVWKNGALYVKNNRVTGALTVTKAQAGESGGFMDEVTVNVSGPEGFEAQTIKLNESNEWTVELTNLPLGEYSVTEAAFTPNDGFSYSVSMKDADGNKTAGSDVDGEVLLHMDERNEQNVVSAAVEITNTYAKVTGDDVHLYPDFKVHKIDDKHVPLAGATFQLAGANLPQNLVYTSDANGTIIFEDLRDGVYTLTELSAPDGYAKDDSVYQVTVAQVGEPVERLENGKHVKYYSYGVSVTKNGTAVSLVNDALVLENHKVLGKLTITKSFGANNAIQPRAVYVTVTGPNGFNNEYTLNNTNNWTVELRDLALGNYVVQEKDASIPGYTLTTTVSDTDGKVTYGNNFDGRVALAVGDLEANFNAPVVSAQVEITNTYTKNTVNIAEVLPNLNLYKLRTGTTDVLLQNAEFKLTGPNGTKTVKTDANGSIIFENLKPGEYELVETAAPAGYALTENTYKFKVEKVSETGEVLQENGTWLNTYTYDIKTVSGTNAAVAVRFIDESNTLAVFNTVNEGSITITKDFGVDSELNADPNSNEFAGKKFTFKIINKKTNAVVETITLPTADGKWTTKIEHLPLGEYQVEEVTDGSDNQGHKIVRGMYEYNNQAYTWTVAYDPNGGLVDITADDENDSVVVTNTFSKIQPGRLDVKKVAADTEKPLEGAQFALYKANERFVKQSGEPLAIYTTTADGIASFSGFLLDGYYVLEEVGAPTNYSVATKHSWNVQVDRYRPPYSWNDVVRFFIDGVEKTNTVTLEVENARTLGDLVINKNVAYVGLGETAISELPAEYRPTAYEFKVTILDDTNQPWNGWNGKTVSVPVDYSDSAVSGSLTIEDVPYGYTYSVQEVAEGKIFAAAVSGNIGKIDAENEVSATNTYTFTKEAPGLSIVKHDSESPKVIAGAEFALYDGADVVATATSDADGKVQLDLPAAGKTYILKETKSADGYHENNNIYSVATKYFYEEDAVNKIVKQIVVVDASEWIDAPNMKLTNPNSNPVDFEFHVMNTMIKPVVVSVEKKWNDDNYYARPESVTVQLYKDDKDTEEVAWVLYDGNDAEVELSASNNWHYAWNGGIAAGLTDEFNWKVEEVEPTGYAAESVEHDDHWVITNTRIPNAIELVVVKKWNDNNDTSYKPTEIEVQLLRDGVPYGEIVTLSEESGWKYDGWTTANDENINDAHIWKVVEIVPDGYKATYSEDGWTITNTRIVRNVELTVTKNWENIPEGYVLPEEVEVVLYKNGEVVEGETRKLTEKDDWTTTWTELKDGSKLTDVDVWTVEEVVDEKLFEVSVEEAIEVATAEDGAKYLAQSVQITNSLIYTLEDLTVTKEWKAPEGYVHTVEAVEVQLYRDGEAYGEAVKLNAENKWTYTWEELEDCFEWEVKEVEVPKGYEVSYSNSGYDWTITNTLDYALENVSVSKVWLNPKDYTQQPTYVSVVLYRDGVAYETVTLSKDNNWSYKWTLLPDCFEWTVDEPNVPAEYSKKIVHVANAWVITNAHKEIPLTGDDSNVLLWAGATGVAGIGLVASLFLLLKKRKEDDDQE